MNCELLKIAHWSHEADDTWRISLMRQMVHAQSHEADGTWLISLMRQMVHGAVSSGMAHQSQSHQTTPVS